MRYSAQRQDLDEGKQCAPVATIMSNDSIGDSNIAHWPPVIGAAMLWLKMSRSDAKNGHGNGQSVTVETQIRVGTELARSTACIRG